MSHETAVVVATQIFATGVNVVKCNLPQCNPHTAAQAPGSTGAGLAAISTATTSGMPRQSSSEQLSEPDIPGFLEVGAATVAESIRVVSSGERSEFASLRERALLLAAGQPNGDKSEEGSIKHAYRLPRLDTAYRRMTVSSKQGPGAQRRSINGSQEPAPALPVTLAPPVTPVSPVTLALKLTPAPPATPAQPVTMSSRKPAHPVTMGSRQPAPAGWRTDIELAGGQPAVLLSKHAWEHVRFWDDIAAPALQCGGMVAETWLHGAGALPAGCGVAACVLNNDVVSLPGVTFGVMQDHAKWAWCCDRRVVCFGDQNRERGQMYRGGSAVCFTTPSLAVLQLYAFFRHASSWTPACGGCCSVSGAA